VSTAFDEALVLDETCLELDTGEREPVPTWRWRADSDAADRLLLDRCCGPTLDVGCGPGRLTRALLDRGIPAVGVDSSAVAHRLTTDRGGLVLRRSVFDPVPGEGNWRHVLLADGNIGIGGDPARLLGRARELLVPGGGALVEVHPPGTGVRVGHANFGGGPWFRWARVGADAIRGLAGPAGFRAGWAAHRGDRWFVELISVEAGGDVVVP
jgi:SAM-dependent methyltransferase